MPIARPSAENGGWAGRKAMQRLRLRCTVTPLQRQQQAGVRRTGQSTGSSRPRRPTEGFSTRALDALISSDDQTGQ